MAPPKPRTKPSATAGALAGGAAAQLGPVRRFVELTSRVIPVTSGLAVRLFARAHAIGALPKLSRARLAALLVPFRALLKATGLGRRLGTQSDTELFFEIRRLMDQGGALEAQDAAKFVAQYSGRENYVLGKLLERFIAPLDELQDFLRQGALVHNALLNHGIKSGWQVVDGLGHPFTAQVVFQAPVRIRNVKRTIINEQGSMQDVEFFDSGFASSSKQGGYWTLGSAQEIKTPGVASNISAQVALREPRIKESLMVEFEYQLPSGEWKKQIVEPHELVSAPGSVVSVGITVQDSRSAVVNVQGAVLKRVLDHQSQYRVMGRGDRQRYHAVIGVPVSNFRALIRAAMKPGG